MKHYLYTRSLRVLSALAVSLCVALIQFNTVTASAAVDCWTTVGSDGTVDESDAQIVDLDQNNVSIKGSVASGTLNIRYNVNKVDEADDNPPGNDNLRLTLRYVDNGASAQIVARLKRVSLNTGTITTLATFNSNNFPQSVSSQTQSVSSACVTEEPFDSDNNAYYLDVEIIRTAGGGVATLRAAKVCEVECP